MFSLLSNDPTGDSHHGEFFAWVMLLWRFAVNIFIGVLVVASMLTVLVFMAVCVKVILFIFGLFITPIPFVER
jgi:hypothetical protein